MIQNSTLLKPALLTLLFFGFLNKTNCQSSGDIYQRLKKLDNISSVLYIAAHPDDENTRLITWLSREKLCRTAYVSLTRGDGGQNLIGEELGVDLGLIRTRELMAARAIDGGVQFFTSAYDFGYSKTFDETLQTWDREKVLADLVYLIRSFKPDVIICRFPPDARAGHGHHSSSAILGHEAFKAASDPLRFPEQLQKLNVWKATRIYWNTFNFGSNNTTSDAQLKFNVGAYNAISGKSCGELAAESRSMHKSQGFGVPRQRGNQTEYFSPVDGDTLTNDLFKGIAISWSDMKNGKVISSRIIQALNDFKFTQPEKSIPSLIAILKELKTLPDSELRNRKISECESLLLDMCGFWSAAYSYRANYAKGDTIHVNLQAITRGSESLILTLESAGEYDTTVTLTLIPQVVSNSKRILPGSMETTQPFWLKSEIKKANFNVPDPAKAIQAWNDAACKIKANVRISDIILPIEIPVTFKQTDPVRGELFDPIFIRPTLNGKLRYSLLVFDTVKTKQNRLVLEYQGNDSIEIRINRAGSGWDDWECDFKDTLIRFVPSDSKKEINLQIRPRKKNADPGLLQFSYNFIKMAEEEALTGIKSITYDHIPPIEWYPVLQTRLVYADAKSTSKLVYYIRGAGDDVPEVLRQLGISVEEMSAEELEGKDLSRADAIVTGIRAYNTDDYLPRVWEKIEQYIRDGGSFVVQYNTNSNLHPARFMAPYPYSISRNRVTEEGAEVKFINPAHSLLNTPNRITESDFKGWVQERGLYFATNADSAYRQILLMHDKGEKDQEGSLIYCRHGKGRYIYTGLAFFRQLPAGNAGALRLFCNLIAKETGMSE
jgi:LmbE family N-acetylglucosaminyl deacetylase